VSRRRMPPGRKSQTSPPTFRGNPVTSKLSIGLIPLLPSRIDLANSAIPIPMLDTGPRPVMTTRRRALTTDYHLLLSATNS
jgi:hypothetical protein